MKKMYFVLAALVFGMNMSAQSIKIYKSGQLVKEYAKTEADSVVFDENSSKSDVSVESTDEYVAITYNGTTMKWAKKNIGATSIADDAATCYGDYYAWGEVDTYYSTKSYTTYDSGSITEWKSSDKTHVTGSKTGYDWSNYCGSQDFAEWTPTPYDATTKILTSTYDAATQKLGGTWRMPTTTDFSNLFLSCGVTKYPVAPRNCTSESDIVINGIYFMPYKEGGIKVGSTTYKVAGYLFVPDYSKLDAVVFFPACGDVEGPMIHKLGNRGYYWSSSLCPDDTDCAYYMTFGLNFIMPQYSYARNRGFAVRPVSE